MGSENKKLIIPYRYMPFDIGTSISDALENKLIKYFDDNHWTPFIDYCIYKMLGGIIRRAILSVMMCLGVVH